jgi:hypothetical protein
MIFMHLATRLVLLGACLGFLPTLSTAQMTASHAPPNTPNIKRIEGTVARVDGNELLLRVKGATTETYQLSPSARIMLSRPGLMTDLSPGRSAGCTSLYSDGATVLAGECHIFPDGMRGIAGGSGPVPASSTPTIDGTITEVRDAVGPDKANGRRLLVRIADPAGATTLTVSSLTEITIIKPGDPSAVKPGAKVRGISEQAADGTGVIQVLTIE